MYATILLALLLTLVAVGEFAQGEPYGTWQTLGAMAALAAGVATAGAALARYVVSRQDQLVQDEQRFLRRVGLLGKGYRLLVLLDYAVMLFALRWPAVVREMVGPTWGVVHVAVTLLPAVVLWVISWTALYWADRGLREAMFSRAGVMAVPPRWTLAGYLVFMFRQYVLVVLVPLLVLIAGQDVLERLVHPENSVVVVGVTGAKVLALVLLAGPWLRLCWRTEPLPSGDLRRRLIEMTRRTGVRVGNILVWRTNVSITNGCMVGLVGPLRYIMVTDALMLNLPNAEIEAVFAHEAAHAKYHHVPLYLALGLGGAGAALLLAFVLFALTESALAVNVGVPAAMVAFWGLGFGYLSRRCELESDLYAVRATSCPAACSEPNPDRRVFTRETDGAAETGLCEHRVAVFASALRRIARLNGSAETAGGWRHFSVARRRAFLARMLASPAAAARFERKMRWLKTGVIAAAALAVAAAGAVLAVDWVLHPDDPQDPPRPEDVGQIADGRVVRLVDGDEVDLLAFGPPQLDRDADPAAEPDDGRPAGQRLGPVSADDDVAVADPRGHAVAVDAEAEQRSIGRRQPRQIKELDDPLGRGFG